MQPLATAEGATYNMYVALHIPDVNERENSIPHE